jgi:hypothetical protein
VKLGLYDDGPSVPEEEPLTVIARVVVLIDDHHASTHAPRVEPACLCQRCLYFQSESFGHGQHWHLYWPAQSDISQRSRIPQCAIRSPTDRRQTLATPTESTVIKPTL